MILFLSLIKDVPTDCCLLVFVLLLTLISLVYNVMTCFSYYVYNLMQEEVYHAIDDSLTMISDKDRSSALKNTKKIYEACKDSEKARTDYTDMVVDVG